MNVAGRDDAGRKDQLVCPHCGNSQLWSDEPASIMYPVTMHRNEAGQTYPNYTGDHYLTMDEGTSYAGDIWCRDCGTQLSEADLAPLVNWTPTPDSEKEKTP